MRNDGYYVTVDNNGEKSLCDVTYLKTIAKIKKAFNTQYENTYATLHIVKVENGIETIVYVKQFDAVRKTNWVTTNRTTEKGWNDLASFEPAEAEVESQPAEDTDTGIYFDDSNAPESEADDEYIELNGF